MPQKPTWNSEISQFLNEERVRVAHQENSDDHPGYGERSGLGRPRKPALDHTLVPAISRHGADPRALRPQVQRVPRGSGIECLRGLGNVWCEVSAVAEAPAMEAILDVLGPSRILWVLKLPDQSYASTCVAMGDQFVWSTKTR